MARESKQKRNEKRFGKPDRTIDMATDPDRWEGTKFLSRFAQTAEGAKGLAKMRDFSINSMSKSVPIVADNVCEYLFAQNPQEEWNTTRDFPCCSPPFPNFFVEFGRPSRMLSEGKVSSTERLPRRWGWHFRSQEHTNEGERTGWTLAASLFMESPTGNILPMAAVFNLEVDGKGVPKKKPTIFIPGGDIIPEDKRQDWIDAFNILSFPALLALSFMNCKNVTTNAVDPDPKLNRERCKAGLKPFLRYHTINIEPMKRVLKTEGNIETEGLTKALHICRGHFATYSEDKPLFGHFTGTVWKPAHVRGSAKQGVVVSDYNVKAPGPNA